MTTQHDTSIIAASGAFRNISVETTVSLHSVDGKTIILSPANRNELLKGHQDGKVGLTDIQFFYSTNSPLLVSVREMKLLCRLTTTALLSLKTIIKDTAKLQKREPDWMISYVTTLYFNQSYQQNKIAIPFVRYNEDHQTYTNLLKQENYESYSEFYKNSTRKNSVYSEIIGKFRLIRPSNLKELPYGESDEDRNSLCFDQMESYKKISNGLYFPMVCHNAEFFDVLRGKSKKIKSVTNRMIK